jgi:drug/metabolite transporter (DMT)-like permease
MALSDHARGYLITLSGVLLLTPDTLLIRLAAVDPMTLAVTRGGLGGTMVMLAMWALHRRGLLAEIRRIRLWAMVVAALQAVGMILFVVALEYTTAANVLIIFATTPLLAALLSWVVIGERVPPATWAAILFCFAGLLIVASGSFGTVHLFGDVLAFLDASALAAFYVVIRRHREVSMIPATGLGLLLAAALAAPFATFAAVSDLQLLWIVLAGAVVVPGSLMLLTLGPRYLTAPEVAMLALLETAIGPFWVWMVLSEEPSNRSILGGTLIVVTLLVHAALRLRRRPIAGPILNVPEPAPDGARSHRPGGP